MYPRIVFCTLALLALAACGQAGPLVLPGKAPPPRLMKPKPAVVVPVPGQPAQAAPAAPAQPDQPDPEEPKKEQP